jgi:hypothetical protein
LESKFEKECINQLRSLRFSWWPPKTPVGSIRGLPDRIGVIDGHFIALEFKRSDKESKDSGRAALQKVTLEQIERAGGFAYFVTPETWPDIYEELFCLSTGSNEYAH